MSDVVGEPVRLDLEAPPLELVPRSLRLAQQRGQQRVDRWKRNGVSWCIRLVVQLPVVAKPAHPSTTTATIRAEKSPLRQRLSTRVAPRRQAPPRGGAVAEYDRGS